MKNERKSSNLVKSHELICHFIRLYLVPLPPYWIVKWTLDWNGERINFFDKINAQFHGILRVTIVWWFFSAPRTCNDLKLLGVTISGDYYINPDGPFSGFPPVKVFCDVKTGRFTDDLVWANLSSTGKSFSEALILLHQLTHNMTIWHWITSSVLENYMLCT